MRTAPTTSIKITIIWFLFLSKKYGRTIKPWLSAGQQRKKSRSGIRSREARLLAVETYRLQAHLAGPGSVCLDPKMQWFWWEKDREDIYRVLSLERVPSHIKLFLFAHGMGRRPSISWILLPSDADWQQPSGSSWHASAMARVGGARPWPWRPFCSTTRKRRRRTGR